MSNSTNHKLPTHFWIVAIAAVIWNVLGVIAYIMEVTMSEEAMAALPEARQALYAAQPAWVTGAFAIAVFAGLLGSIALALRKSLATPIFVVSLVAVVVQMFYAFVLSNMLDVMGASSAIMPSVIIVIAAALVWFSTRARAKGWTG
jgi:hypothetical protein